MHTIKRNLGWLLLSQTATWGVAIVLLLVTPRKLGDHAFGQMSFAMVYVSFFELIGLFGTGTFLMKVIARNADALGRYVFNTLVMKFLVSIALVALALGLAVALGFDSDTIVLIAFFCISMVCNVTNNALAGGLQGLQQMGRPARWDIVRSYVGGLVGLFVLLSTGSLALYVFVFNAACVIPVLGNGIYLWPRLRRHRVDLDLWREIVVGSVPFFIWSALLIFYGSIDIPLLKGLAGDETVGWYALAYRWVSLPAFIAATVSVAFFPVLSAERVHIPENFARTANRALYVVALIATPAAIGIALIASDFMRTFYGTEFQQSVPLMRILALHIPIVGLDTVLGTVLITADKQRQWVLVGVTAAVFNPLLNLAAIPLTENHFGNAAIGAAVVTVLTELLLMIGAIRLRPAGVLDGRTARLLLRIVAATFVMVPVVLALSGAPLVVRCAAGAASYGAASIAFGTISLHDVRRWTLGSLGRRRQESSVLS